MLAAMVYSVAVTAETVRYHMPGAGSEMVASRDSGLLCW